MATKWKNVPVDEGIADYWGNRDFRTNTGSTQTQGVFDQTYNQGYEDNIASNLEEHQTYNQGYEDKVAANLAGGGGATATPGYEYPKIRKDLPAGAQFTNPDLADAEGNLNRKWSKKALRFQRAQERAAGTNLMGNPNLILDPMYRQELIKQKGSRPLLKDYIGQGPGAWLQAMRDWRSQSIDNPYVTDAYASVGSNVDMGDSLLGQLANPEVMPGSMSPEDEEYYNNPLVRASIKEF